MANPAASPALLAEPARAKVNLFLHVVGRRADGYHLLDSLAVFPGVGDVVRAGPGARLTLGVTGRFGAGLAAEGDNLVLRAARALAGVAGVPAVATLSLEKNLPVSSGIGGGSADAAAALRVLVQLWGVPVPADELTAIAAGLGADVPVCLGARPARMGGIGEVLSDAPALPPCGMVLINPGVAVSTPAVFRARAAGFSAPGALPRGWATAHDLAAGLAATANDLETPATALAPEIAAVLAWLRQSETCLLARMSGSGATCFGLFPDAAVARRVAALAPQAWWAWGGEMLPAETG